MMPGLEAFAFSPVSRRSTRDLVSRSPGILMPTGIWTLALQQMLRERRMDFPLAVLSILSSGRDEMREQLISPRSVTRFEVSESMGPTVKVRVVALIPSVAAECSSGWATSQGMALTTLESAPWGHVLTWEFSMF